MSRRWLSRGGRFGRCRFASGSVGALRRLPADDLQHAAGPAVPDAGLLDPVQQRARVPCDLDDVPRAWFRRRRARCVPSLVRRGPHRAHDPVAGCGLRRVARGRILARGRRRSRDAARGAGPGVAAVAGAARDVRQHVLAAVDVPHRPRHRARAAREQRPRGQALRRRPRGWRARMPARAAAHGPRRRRPGDLRDRRAGCGRGVPAGACARRRRLAPRRRRARRGRWLLAVVQQRTFARRPPVAPHDPRRRRRLGARRPRARARLERGVAPRLLPDEGRRPDLRAHRFVVPDDDPEQGSATHEGIRRAHELRAAAVRARPPSSLPRDRRWRRARHAAREGTRGRARHGCRDQPGHRRGRARPVSGLWHGRDRPRPELRAAQRRRPQLRAWSRRALRQPHDHVHPDRCRERLCRVRAVRGQPLHRRCVRRVPRQARARRRVLRLSPRRRRMPAPRVDGARVARAPLGRGLALAPLHRAQFAQRVHGARRPLAAAQGRDREARCRMRRVVARRDLRAGFDARSDGRTDSARKSLRCVRAAH